MLLVVIQISSLDMSENLREALGALKDLKASRELAASSAQAASSPPDISISRANRHLPVSLLNQLNRFLK